MIVLSPETTITIYSKFTEKSVTVELETNFIREQINNLAAKFYAMYFDGEPVRKGFDYLNGDENQKHAYGLAVVAHDYYTRREL